MTTVRTTMEDKELNELLALARDKSVSGRKTLMDAVSDLFCDNQTVLSDRERALMTDILHQLVHDVEMSVRRALAERLAMLPTAPRELIIELANDQIEVAHPILMGSKVLHDTDLVEIIHQRTLEHQLAIAMRKNINESVTDALVESGNEDVVKTMLENPSARISRATMEYLVEQSKRVDTYQNPLLKRPDLEPALAKRMYLWVSAALRSHILTNFKIDSGALDETIEGAIDEAIASHQANHLRPSKPTELADRLFEEGKNSPRLLVQLLRQGEVALFEALFAKMSGIRIRLLRRLLFEPGGEALAIVCRAVGIDKPDFATIFMLSRKAHAADRVTNPRELSKVLEFFDRLKQDTAKKVLSRWQRSSEYLNALRLLEDAQVAPSHEQD
jgi:uncharacterized protein (DUF2336 family)